MEANMEKDDISTIIVRVDSLMLDLKRETRSMIDADKDRITDIILDMRWQLARALTTIGKNVKD
jgi:hypothetical protein